MYRERAGRAREVQLGILHQMDDCGDLCACLACSALCGACCAAAADDRRRDDDRYYQQQQQQRVVYVEPVAYQQQQPVYYQQPGQPQQPCAPPYAQPGQYPGQVVYAQPVPQQQVYGNNQY